MREICEAELGGFLAALTKLGVFLKDFTRDRHVPNHLWCEWGYTADDMRGDRWLEALHADDRERVRGRFADHESGKDPVSQSEYRVVTKSGDTRWVLSKSVMVSFAEDRAPERMVGIDYDITDLKRAEAEALRARHDADRLRREAGMLRHASSVIAATLDRHQAVAKVLEFLRSMVPYVTATVQVLSGDSLEVVDCAGPVARSCTPGSIIRVDRVAQYAQVVQQRRSVLLACPTDACPDLPTTADTESVAWIGVPLVAQDQVIGLLTVAADACDRFTEQHHDLVRAMGDFVALAIQNANLYAEAREAATRDTLTGAFTRYWFEPYAEREIARARRDREPLSVILLDLDHFKLVNDEFGHHAGDVVLRAIAEEITRTLRMSDPLCRTGGEEFAILLPRADAETALSIGSRVCDVARTLAHDCIGGRAVTVSAGVATLGDGRASYETLMRAADTALYQSKRRGRDRVTAAS